MAMKILLQSCTSARKRCNSRARTRAQNRASDGRKLEPTALCTAPCKNGQIRTWDGGGPTFTKHNCRPVITAFSAVQNGSFLSASSRSLGDFSVTMTFTQVLSPALLPIGLLRQKEARLLPNTTQLTGRHVVPLPPVSTYPSSSTQIKRRVSPLRCGHGAASFCMPRPALPLLASVQSRASSV